MASNTIPLINFEKAFAQVGWIKKHSDSNYDVWASTTDKDKWTVIPKVENTEEYFYYQVKNIKLLMSQLNIQDTEYNTRDIYSQILGYNYKLISRVETGNNSESIPFEFAQNIPLKTIDTFRYFYHSKQGGKDSLSMDDFRLHHTIRGSFIIPVSILVRDEKPNQEPLLNIVPKMNLMLREYLEKVDIISKIPVEDKMSFSKTAFEAGIESNMLKDFLGLYDSIAKYKEKYTEEIKAFSITSTSSPFLDHNLTVAEKRFPEVDLGNLKPVPDDFIKKVEDLEVQADDATVNEHNVEIEVMVDLVQFDEVEDNHKAKFNVLSINGKKLSKHFKAYSVELPRRRLDICTDTFKSREVLKIVGDISKTKGKVGKIVPEDFIVKESKDKQVEMF